MVIRPLRAALLALAAWAVLFAPGAARIDAGDTSPLDADRVAASIVAPTFGPDGVVLSRTVRALEDDVVLLVSTAILAAALLLARAAVVSDSRDTPGRIPTPPTVSTRGARAPPVV